MTTLLCGICQDSIDQRKGGDGIVIAICDSCRRALYSEIAKPSQAFLIEKDFTNFDGDHGQREAVSDRVASLETANGGRVRKSSLSASALAIPTTL